MFKINSLLKNVYILTFILVILFSFLFLGILNKKAIPVIMSYANVQTKRIAIEVLRTTGLKEVNKMIKKEEPFTTIKNNSGEIESIDFNTSLLNETLIVVAKSVRRRLREIEKGEKLPLELYQDNLDNRLKKGIIYEVPIGVVFKNSFLSNMGPRVPVKIEYTGNVGLDVKSRVKSYGLNSALIEIYIYVEVTQRTILPFQSSDIKVTSEIPVIMKVVKGSVSNYLPEFTESYSLPMK